MAARTSQQSASAPRARPSSPREAASSPHSTPPTSLPLPSSLSSHLSASDPPCSESSEADRSGAPSFSLSASEASGESFLRRHAQRASNPPLSRNKTSSSVLRTSPFRPKHRSRASVLDRSSFPHWSAFLLSLLLSALLVLVGSPSALLGAHACPRRVLRSPASPALSKAVKVEIERLIAVLSALPQQYGTITAYLQQQVADPNADFAWGANTTWLLPSDKAIQLARKKNKAFTGTVTACHFIQTRRAYSLPVCNQPLPIYFLDDTWQADAAGGGADWGGTTCTVQRYTPPATQVFIGSVTDQQSRARVVHPSLYECDYFTVQGVDSVMFT